MTITCLPKQRGWANGRQIVPKEWIDDITNSAITPFGKPYTDVAANGAYRNQFWIMDVSRNVYMARGVFGQLIYIDPANALVAVKLSSWPEFTSVSRLQTTLAAIQQVTKHLSND